MLGLGLGVRIGGGGGLTESLEITLLASFDISDPVNIDSFTRDSEAGYTGVDEDPFAQTAAVDELRDGHYVEGVPCVLLEDVVTPPASSLTADLWQTFEFDTLDATALASNDGASGGTWSVSDAGSKLSTSVSGERAMTSAVNGVSDTGTRGLARALGGGVTAQVDYAFSAAKNGFSAGLWVKTVALGSFSLGWQVLAWGDTQGGGGFAKVLAQMRNQGTGAAELASVGITEGNWYFLAVKFARNAASTASVYDTTGALVGTHSFTGFDSDATFIRLGGTADSHAVTGYVDDLLIDWTDSTDPLGP